MTTVQLVGLAVVCLSVGILAGWWARGGADAEHIAVVEAERDEAWDHCPDATVLPIRRSS